MQRGLIYLFVSWFYMELFSNSVTHSDRKKNNYSIYMYRCFAKAQTFLFMIKWCRWVIKSFAIAEYWFGQNIDTDERLFFCSIVSITSLKFYYIFSWYFNFLLVHYLPQNCYILTIVLSLCLWLYFVWY